MYTNYNNSYIPSTYAYYNSGGNSKMKNLELKITKSFSLDTICLIDGKELKRKKNQQGSFIYDINTDKDELEIKIFTINELSGKYWYIPAILLFIISFLGLLNPKYNTKGKSINFTGTIKLPNENNKLSISYNMFKKDTVALNFKGDCEVLDNETNLYYIDELILKRLKKLKIFKIIIRLLVIIILFIIIII